jgi:hypothetical protein
MAVNEEASTIQHYSMIRIVNHEQQEKYTNRYPSTTFLCKLHIAMSQCNDTMLQMMVY